MGYGSRALSLLKDYYEQRIASLDDNNVPTDTINSIQDDEIGLLQESIGKIFYI